MDVARECASDITSHQETTSLTVKFLSATLSSGRTSRVPTCTISPGFLAR